MNKKLLLGAALLVGMGVSFTSCVDSTESATVTAIRNAKAEQLKSIADYNKAQAEAALIIANAQQAAQAANEAYQQAQAALIAAQAEQERAEAEYKKGLAAYWQAQAEYIGAQTDAERAKLQTQLDILAQQLEELKLKNDKAKVELENAQDQLAYNKAYLANEIEKLAIALEKAKVGLELDKVNLDKEIQRYQDMLTEAANKADAKAKQEIIDKVSEVENLKTKYVKAGEKYFEAKKTLAEAEADLMKLQSNLESAENLLAKKIATKKQTQAEDQAKLLADQDLLAFYQKYAGQEVTPEVLAAAIDNEKAAKEELDKANDAVTAAKDAFAAATDALDDSEFKTLVNKTIWNSETEGSQYSTYMWRYWVENSDGEYDYMTCQIVYIPSTEDNSTYAGAVPTECRGKWVVKTGKAIVPNQGSTSYLENPVYTYTPIYEAPKYEVATIPVTSIWEWEDIENEIRIDYSVNNAYDPYNPYNSYSNYISIRPSDYFVNVWGHNQYGDYYDVYGNQVSWQFSAKMWVEKLQELELSYVEQSYYTPIEAGLNAWKAWRDAQIQANPKNIKDLQAAITEATGYAADAQTIYAKYSDLADAEDALAKAEAAKAELDLVIDATEAEKTAAATAVTKAEEKVAGINADIDKDAFQDKREALQKYIFEMTDNNYMISNKTWALTALHDVNNILTDANNALLIAQNDAANKDFTVSKVDELVANVLDQAPESEKLVEAANKAAEAQASAELAASIADEAYTTAQTELSSLSNCYNLHIPFGGNDIFNGLLVNIQTEINDLKDAIADRETTIAELEAEAANYSDTAENDYGELYKVLIAKQEAEVEKCKEYVAMYENLYNLAKEALETALKGDATTETPAE